ncbi:MAG: M28 family peptidase [Solirubrobacterales bacterium]|nr:M28 family peptidase [Solirubrobacterales bacterium]
MIRSARTFVALLAVSCLLTGVSTAAAAPAFTAPRISLSVSAQVGSQTKIVARGSVTPASSRGRVVLQLHKAKGWRELGTGPVRRGKFKITHALSAGVRAARVRALLFEGRRRIATSSVRTVRVQRKKPAPTPAPPIAPFPPAPVENPLSEASLMATVQQYSALPNHLSGTANSAAALGEITGRLAAAGLRLGEQAFTYPGFLPTQVALSAGPTPVPAAAIAPLVYSGITPEGGVTAELFDGGNGAYDKSEVAGKIVVVSIAYQNNSKGVNLESAIELAVEGGAKGLVAVTQGVGDYPKWQDSNARDGTGPLPVLMVGKVSGATVIAAAEAEENGNLVLRASTATACDRDVWGELEGAEPGRRVFVGVPASSFTPSASEHGSGVAILLGLARHYAEMPKSQRPETLIFIAVGGHEVGWLGLQALMSGSHASWFTEADAYVHLGSSLGAPTAEEEPSGAIKTSPVPDPTGRLHDSENPLLEPSIGDDFAAAGVPTPNTSPFVASGGEQTYAYAAGVPIASFSGSSLYFHTAGDLPSTLSPTILTEDAEAFRRSVDTITALPPGQLRAENSVAAQHGTEINAAKRAPTNPTLGSGGSLGSGGVGGPPATPVGQCP